MLDPRLRISSLFQPVPQIWPWQKGGALDFAIASIGQADKKMLVRITGGCAEMSDDDAHGVLDLFSAAFSGYRGALLIGGTRMIVGKDKNNILFGITEVGPIIRTQNPLSYVLGVMPRVVNTQWDEAHNILMVNQKMLPEERPGPEFTTIVHPNQDLIVAANAGEALTDGKIWDDELAFCEDLMEMKRTLSRWPTLTLAYNGGGTTEKELRRHASLEWPVLVIGDSGRRCNDLAKDKAFCRMQNVEVCDNDAESFRDALISLKVIDPPAGATRKLLRAVGS